MRRLLLPHVWLPREITSPGASVTQLSWLRSVQNHVVEVT